MKRRASLLLSFAVAAGVRAGPTDSRIWTVHYEPDAVIPITGFVGYHIDFEFAPNETFVNLGAGDTAALDVGAEGNHLFLKPKVVTPGTNLTIVTNQRAYHLDYRVLRRKEDGLPSEIVYAVRFTYPAPPVVAAAPAPTLNNPPILNTDYWFCGSSSLKPTTVSDDGVHTRLTFAPRTELPAVFVKSPDGAESLINFHVDDGVVVIHRIAQKFVLRRGREVACIENHAYDRTGMPMNSGTVSPDAIRQTREINP